MPASEALIAKLASQGAPHSHLSRLADLVALAERDPGLLAIALVGSYAKGVGDRISDLDLVAIVAPGQGAAVLAAAHRLLTGPAVLHQFTRSHPAGGFWKLVYLDFTSVELHVFEQDTAFRLKRPYLAVWDPADRLAAYVVEGAPIAHEDFTAYEHGDEGLIWELVDCIKWLSRGRTALARHHILKLAAAMKARDGS